MSQTYLNMCREIIAIALFFCIQGIYQLNLFSVSYTPYVVCAHKHASMWQKDSKNKTYLMWSTL